jgi:hypothetical protein
MMYPYTKFELNVCNRYRDNERKPIYEMTEWRRVTLYAPAISWRGHKKVVLLLHHERIYDYHNDVFLQISKILELKGNIFTKTVFIKAEMRQLKN